MCVWLYPLSLSNMAGLFSLSLYYTICGGGNRGPHDWPRFQLSLYFFASVLFLSRRWACSCVPYKDLKNLFIYLFLGFSGEWQSFFDRRVCQVTPVASMFNSRGIYIHSRGRPMMMDLLHIGSSYFIRKYNADALSIPCFRIVAWVTLPPEMKDHLWFHSWQSRTTKKILVAAVRMKRDLKVFPSSSKNSFSSAAPQPIDPRVWKERALFDVSDGRRRASSTPLTLPSILHPPKMIKVPWSCYGKRTSDAPSQDRFLKVPLYIGGYPMPERDGSPLRIDPLFSLSRFPKAALIKNDHSLTSVEQQAALEDPLFLSMVTNDVKESTIPLNNGRRDPWKDISFR